MRCFYVLVHGKLNWCEEPAFAEADPDGTRPSGFYCHRYVLASGGDEAGEKALRRVHENLDAQTGWMRDGLATLDLEAEEVDQAPMRKLVKPDNRGHTFYY